MRRQLILFPLIALMVLALAMGMIVNHNYTWRWIPSIVCTVIAVRLAFDIQRARTRKLANQLGLFRH